MIGRSRISPLPLSWQLGVFLVIICLEWSPEVSSLRTTPIIGKYSKVRQESLRGTPVREPEAEEVGPELHAPPVQDPVISPYRVGIIAKSTVSPLEGDEEGGNGTTKSPLTGIPQIDYLLDPNLPRELNGYNLTDYPFYVAVPDDITFKCDGLHDGFYASVPHKCQVYHHCLFGTRYDFLCANYTAFDQKTFICHFVSEVDCENSPKYYKRNEALYKAATTTSTSTTTTTTTTPAPTPAPQSLSQPSGERVGLGGRRRRPARRRRPQYEYYYEDDYGDDDYTEEDEVEYTRPSQSSRRRKKKPMTNARERPRNEEEDFPDEEEYTTRRRKQRPRTRPQSNRRPIEDDIEEDFEEDPPETSASGVGLVPVGTSSSRGKGVFDKPRAPPKIRPPVPLNERDKYNYGRQGASGSSSGSAPLAPAKPARGDDYEDEVVERRTKKRPTQPPPQAKTRDEYYDEEEEEYERIPPSRGSNQNRRRKGQGSSRLKPAAEPEEEDDQYEYDAREESRGADRYPSSGSRDIPRRRKRPQAAPSSVPVKRRRPGYRRDEDEYDYEEEEDTRVRPTNTRYKDTQSRGSDDDDYMERYPSRQTPSRGVADVPTRKRVQPPLRSSPSRDRPRPQASVYQSRKRLPAPVHEVVDEDLSEEEELEEESEEVRPAPKERKRGGERVRVVKHRITTSTTTTKAPPPPPPPPRVIPRTTTTTAAPLYSRESLEEELEDGEYYDSEEAVEREPKTPEPPVSRRPFRPSAPSTPNNGGAFVGSGRSVPASSLQSFLPRGLQALGDRAQNKEIITVVVPGTTSRPSPVIHVTTATTTTTTSTATPTTTKSYRQEEPQYLERPHSVPNIPLSYKQLTQQYNGRQPTPKLEVQTQSQGTPFTRAPFATNARPGYTTKSLPTTLYSQKPRENILPPQPQVDSVPNQTDYDEDDFINDALHPTIPSSSSFPVTAAAASLSTRHGISLSQQQRTTLSTPTQVSYRFRNTPQSSPAVDYRTQTATNPTFSNKGAPLHTSASQQTLSFIQPPPFVPPSAQQSELYHQQVSDSYQGSSTWTSPTRIVVY